MKKYKIKYNGKHYDELEIFRALQRTELFSDSLISPENEDNYCPIRNSPIAGSFPVLKDYFTSIARAFKRTSKFIIFICVLSSVSILVILLQTYIDPTPLDMSLKYFIGLLDSNSTLNIAIVIIFFLLPLCLLTLLLMRQLYLFWKIMPTNSFISPFWRVLIYMISGPFVIVLNFFILPAPAYRFTENESKETRFKLCFVAFALCFIPIILLVSPLILGKGIAAFFICITLNFIAFIFLIYYLVFTSKFAEKRLADYLDKIPKNIVPENPIYRANLRHQRFAVKRNTALIILFILVTTSTLYLQKWIKSYVGYTKTMEKLEKNGVIFDIEKFNDMYTPSDEMKKVATDFIRELKIAKEALDSPEMHLLDLHSLTDKDIENWKILIEKHHAFFEASERMTAIDNMLWDVDWRELYGALLPHLNSLRSAARIYGLNAKVAFAQGDMEETMHSLKMIEGLRNAIQNEPSIISGLVGFAIDTIRISALQEMFLEANSIKLADDDLRYLIQTSFETEKIFRANFGKNFDCEIIAVDTTLQWKNQREFIALTYEDTPYTSLLMLRFYIYSHHGYNDRKFFMETNFKWSKCPQKEFVTYVSELSDSPQEAINKKYIISGMLLSSSATFEKLTEICARNRVCATAMMAELYRRKHNKLPENHDELTKEFPDSILPDPFTGEELIFKKGEFTYHFNDKGDTNVTKNGLIIYSVGRNGSDEGGIHRPPPNKLHSTKFDLPFFIKE